LLPGERDDGNGNSYAIDRLWGSDDLRLAVDRGEDPRYLSRAPESPVVWCGDGALLY